MARPKKKPETLRKDITLTLDPMTIKNLELLRKQTSISISKIIDIIVEDWIKSQHNRFDFQAGVATQDKALKWEQCLSFVT